MNSQIKEQRTINYFIEATKTTIMSEGIVALNVRNIATRAGYSPATLYAYFKNLNNLILQSCISFGDDFVNYLKENCSGSTNKKDVYKYYIRYFIQYPSLFNLFFLETMPLLRNDKTIISNILEKIREISNMDAEENYQYFTTINGFLMLYLNRNIPENYQEFDKKINDLFK